jgi:GTP-binding protein
MEVHGRGELQMGILLETMRREQFEVSVSPPKVLFKEENGKKFEPVEEVVMEVSTDVSAMVMDKMKLRGATLNEFKELPNDKCRLLYHCPSRTLMGYRSEFKMDTKGTGTLYSIYHSHQEYNDPGQQGPSRGAIISTDMGEATAHSLESIQTRGVLFIEPGSQVYEGMVIGEHNRPEDLPVNPCKKKQLTNIRTVMKEDNVRLYPIRQISLEDAITYIRPDEMVEVTPKAIRLRKKVLSLDERNRLARNSKSKAL